MLPQEIKTRPQTLKVPEQFGPLLKLILRNTWRQFLKNLPWTILFAILTYIGYTIFVIFLNDGFAKKSVPGAGLLGLGGGWLTGLSGGVIFMLVSGLVAGLVGNAFKKGPSGALKEFFCAPKKVFDYIGQAGDLALAGFLSGAGISLVLGYMLTGFGNIAAAVGVSLLLFSRAGQVLALLLRSAWGSTYGAIQGVRGQAFGIAAGHVALMGAALGFVIKSVLPGWSILLGVIFLVVALILAKGKGKSSAQAAGILLVCVLALWFLQAHAAWAHDGGWKENQGNFWVWIRTLGALISLLTGLGPAAGILFGVAFVQALLGIADSLPPDLTAEEPRPEPSQPPETQKDTEPRPARIDPMRIDTVLIDPETGQPLVVQDGRYEGGQPGQVWYQGGWMDRSRAEQLIRDKEAEYERDRREWFDERSAEREKDVQSRREREGYIYNREKDAWVPGPDHPEVIAAQRTQQAQHLDDFIDRNVKDPGRADFLQDLVDRINQSGGDLDALQSAIKDNTVGADQQRNMGDAESNLAEADALKSSEDYTTEVQKWTQRANRAIGHFVPGSGAIINMVQGGAYGAIQGYDEGGWRGALSASAAQGADAALQNITGVPGIGSALREQYGSGYERDENGNLVSPLDRMTDKLWHNFADQYDPRVYADRINRAEGLGDLADVGLDAWDARDDLRNLKDRLTGPEQPEGRADTEADADEPGGRRPPEEDRTGPKPDEAEQGGRIRADEGDGGPKTAEDEAAHGGLQRADESGSGRKPVGDEAELGGDRKDRRPTRSDGRKLGEQSADGSFDIDQDNITKNSLQQYQTQIRKGGDVFQPQAETMDCTVATISKVTGQTYEDLDGNDRFTKLRSDLTTEGDHQGGLKRSSLQQAIQAAGADAEPVVTGADGPLKPGSDEFVRKLEDRINKGEQVVVSMNDPDTGGGHAVHIKGVVSEHGITKLQIEDPRRGPLEVPVAVVEKRNLVDWENSYFVKSKDASSAAGDAIDPGGSRTHVPAEPNGKDNLGGGYETDPDPAPREKGDLARRQGLAVETPVARTVVQDKQWDSVWEPKEEGGHGFDHVAKAAEDGRYKVVEIKKDSATENIGDNRVLYDRNGEPLREQINGEWVDKKGTVYQGSRDWVWQKIHDLKNSPEPHDQQVAADLTKAMQEKKLDYVLVKAEVDTANREIRTSYYESEPQPGATTGMPSAEPGRNMTQPAEGPKMKLPEDYPMGPKKK